MKKSLEYYLSLNYPIEISRLSKEDGGGYYACIPQLGRYAFQGDGDTLEEALKELETSKKMLFEDFLEKGMSIPEPKEENEESYSGKFIVRLPKSLHKSLVEKAQEEGVSLNQWVGTLLSASAAVHGNHSQRKAGLKRMEKSDSGRTKSIKKGNIKQATRGTVVSKRTGTIESGVLKG